MAGLSLIVQVRVSLIFAEDERKTVQDAFDLAVRHTEDPGDLAQQHPRLEEHMVGDHRAMPRVLPQHRLQDPVALVPGEVDIDVRRVGAPGIQEPLEVQVELHRTDIGDAQAVRNNGCGARAAAAGARAALDDLAHDQEVVAEPLALDQREFVFDPLDDVFGQVLSVALGGARVGPFAQYLCGGPSGRIAPLREDGRSRRPGEDATLRDGLGGRNGLGLDLEAAPILGRIGQPCLGRSRVAGVEARERGV
jgi:hypothetical protein